VILIHFRLFWGRSMGRSGYFNDPVLVRAGYKNFKNKTVISEWDVDTWWNSTYRIFHHCFPYKRAIFEILSNSIEGSRLLLSAGEWSQLELLKNFLHVFFNANEKLFYSYIPFRTWVASASIYNFQSKLSLWNLVSFIIYYYLYLIFYLFIFSLQGLSWDGRYGKSQPFSCSDRTSNEREISQILGRSTGDDHYRKLSPSVIQEEVYCTDDSKIQ
jgi:hypothetical protein